MEKRKGFRRMRWKKGSRWRKRWRKWGNFNGKFGRGEDREEEVDGIDRG